VAILPIKVVGHPALRTKAKKVAKVDRHVQRLLDDMVETMREAPGVGLAANQVGVLQRLIVVEVDQVVHQLINPEILLADGEQVSEEGCLSLPGYSGAIARASKVVAQARDRQGKPLKIAAHGLLAVVLQHEIDHLNGVLFVDKLVSLASLRYQPVEVEVQEIRL